jgi:hypothetical protein
MKTDRNVYPTPKLEGHIVPNVARDTIPKGDASWVYCKRNAPPNLNGRHCPENHN